MNEQTNDKHVSWGDALLSKESLKEKLSTDWGFFGALLFFAAMLLILPTILLIGLSMIGVDIEWLSPITWIGAVIVTYVFG